jgi:hypothetical protein
MDYREDIGYETTLAALEDEGRLHPVEDILAYLREYARERPEAMALTCLAVGFVLGWKLKPW